jgi:hypothetical protein
MSDPIDPLIVDLVEWVVKTPRPYAEMIDAWRTSCPRLTVWEEACARGLVVRRSVAGAGTIIEITDQGRALLANRH